MNSAENFFGIELSVLAHRCHQESARFFRGQESDSRYCYEIFRRAVWDRNEQAWQTVFDEFGPVTTGWVRKHGAFPSCHEEAIYFVNRAFERFWMAVTPDKFNRMGSLERLLVYLRMCVHSAIQDHLRMTRRFELAKQADRLDSSAASPAEDQVLTDMQRDELWTEVYKRMKSNKEKILLRAAFALEMKSAEIFDRYDDVFKSVDEIYRIRQNLLARLKRDSVLMRKISR